MSITALVLRFMQTNCYQYPVLVVVFFLMAGTDAVAQVPTISTGITDSLTYVEGSGARVVDPTITLTTNAGGQRFSSGYVLIKSGFIADQDSLYINTATGISSTWTPATGRLDLGSGKLADYQVALRALSYLNSSSVPDASDRVIEFVVVDKNGTSAPYQRVIKIQEVNDPPWLYLSAETSQVDTLSYDAIEDQSKEICPTIYDPESDDYAIQLDLLKNNSGTVTLSEDKQCFTYVPNADFFGVDYVQLTLFETANPSNTRSAVITLNVQSVNDAPVLSGVNDTIGYTENDGVKLINTGTVITDDSQNLTAARVQITENYLNTEDSLVFTSTNALLSFTWNDNQGSLEISGNVSYTVYREALRAIGYVNSSEQPDTTPRVITMRVTDAQANSELTETVVTISRVNDAPFVYRNTIGNQPDTIVVSTEEDTYLKICPDIYDYESDPWTLSLVTTGDFQSTVSIDSETNCLDFTPRKDLNTTEYLQLNVCDSLATSVCSSVIYQVTILPVNDAPVLSGVNDTIGYTENDGVKLINTGTVITDDSQKLTAARVQITENYLNTEDSLVFTSTNALLSFTWNDNQGSLEISGNVSYTDYREALRAIGYVNSSEQPDTTPRVITMRVTDAQANSELIETVVTISRVNDAPFVYRNTIGNQPDTIVVSTEEDTLLKICPDIYDYESDPWTLSLVTTADFQSTVSLDSETNCVDFTPRKDLNTTEYLQLNVCDSLATSVCSSVIYQVTILPVNDAPVIVDNGVAVDSLYFGTELNQLVQVCIEAEDIENNNLSISSVPGPYKLGTVANISGLCFEYTPGLDSIGTEYLQVIICDDAAVAKCDTLIVEIEFPSINTAPEFEASSDTLSRGALVSQPFSEIIKVQNRERDSLILDTAYLVNAGGQLDISLTGELEYTFSPSASDSVLTNQAYIKICDDRNPSLCSELVIDFTINYPPVLLDANERIIDSLAFRMLENNVYDTCFTLQDLNSQSVFNSSIVSTGAGTLTTNLDNQNQQMCLLYEPEIDFVGEEQFSISICDNGDPEGCSEVIILFEVFDTNTSPVFAFLDNPNNALVTFSLRENDTLYQELPMLDAESDQIFIDSIYSKPDELEISIADTILILDFKPGFNDWGTYEASILVCDDNPFPLCAQLDIVFDVQPINEMPIIQRDSVEITNSDEIKLYVLENDSDPEDEGLTITDLIDQSTDQGTVYLEDSVIVYQPDPDEYRDRDVITYTICDGGVPQACVQTTLTVYFNLPIPGLVIYEAFSPNGDGINDTWFLDGIREFPENQVTILDQYNNTVFQTVGYDNRENIWSGEADRPGQSIAVPDGTYYYVIDLGIGQSSLNGYVILKR
ncbi:MAG: gliding motility-associated-like protein [Cyclobacteriaceae bacterium]|jgi:gliding motility-associated-like protein